MGLTKESFNNASGFKPEGVIGLQNIKFVRVTENVSSPYTSAHVFWDTEARVKDGKLMPEFYGCGQMEFEGETVIKMRPDGVTSTLNGNSEFAHLLESFEVSGFPKEILNNTNNVSCLFGGEYEVYQQTQFEKDGKTPKKSKGKKDPSKEYEETITMVKRVAKLPSKGVASNAAATTDAKPIIDAITALLLENGGKVGLNAINTLCTSKGWIEGGKPWSLAHYNDLMKSNFIVDKLDVSLK
jgi:hypothetical protein